MIPRVLIFILLCSVISGCTKSYYFAPRNLDQNRPYKIEQLEKGIKIEDDSLVMIVEGKRTRYILENHYSFEVSYSSVANGIFMDDASLNLYVNDPEPFWNVSSVCIDAEKHDTNSYKKCYLHSSDVTLPTMRGRALSYRNQRPMTKHHELYEGDNAHRGRLLAEVLRSDSTTYWTYDFYYILEDLRGSEKPRKAEGQVFDNYEVKLELSRNKPTLNEIGDTFSINLQLITSFKPCDHYNGDKDHPENMLGIDSMLIRLYNYKEWVHFNPPETTNSGLTRIYRYADIHIPRKEDMIEVYFTALLLDSVTGQVISREYLYKYWFLIPDEIYFPDMGGS